MATYGVVREWFDEEGWGVIDSDETPGGCWAHFSSLRMPGYRTVAAGDAVEMIAEQGRQDGFDYRAEAFWPRGTEPVDEVVAGPSAAYQSSLTIWFDVPTDGPTDDLASGERQR